MPPFLPVTTERLVLRSFRPADAEPFAAYRSEPAVARYQSWTAPYALSAAHRLIAEVATMDGPQAGTWIQIAAELDGVLVGDVAVGLDAAADVATIGYTFAPPHQGRGLAREAVGAVVTRLFAVTGVHRVEAAVDPRNIPSARLVEALGFELDGIAKEVVRDGSGWADEARYALTADGHAAWRDRPVGPPATVELVEITPATARAMLDVRTHPTQERFVAPVASSYADALFPDVIDGAPIVPWLRAIEADGELVGFMMMAAASERHPEPYLWRLLIDRRHQRRGIGARALTLLVEELRAGGHRAVLVDWDVGPGSPEPFYLRRGFVQVRNIGEDQVLGRLDL